MEYCLQREPVQHKKQTKSGTLVVFMENPNTFSRETSLQPKQIHIVTRAGQNALQPLNTRGVSVQDRLKHRGTKAVPAPSITGCALASGRHNSAGSGWTGHRPNMDGVR